MSVLWDRRFIMRVIVEKNLSDHGSDQVLKYGGDDDDDEDIDQDEKTMRRMAITS